VWRATWTIRRGLHETSPEFCPFKYSGHDYELKLEEANGVMTLTMRTLSTGTN
jgi:hypothetical protein